MNEQDKQKLRDAGYSEDDIAMYEKSYVPKETVPAPPASAASADNPYPSAVAQPLPDYVPAGQGTQDHSYLEDALTLGQGALEVGKAVGPYAGGAYGIYKGAQAINTAGQYIAAQRAQAAAAAAQAEADRIAAQGIQNRFDVRQGRVPNAPVAPESVPRYNVPTSNTPQARMPVPGAGPVAPEVVPGEAQFAELGRYRPGLDMPRTGLPPGTATPTQEAGAGFLDRMMQMASKYAPAAERIGGQVARVAAPIARIAGSAPVLGAQLMLHSGETGPQVPSVGRQRGSEINQLTGRPWTANEIAAYQRNPDMYDRQLPAAQLPR